MDLDILQFLAAPFAASLILTGIHAYLGVHVVERGVIFVDLSLAQIAALGAHHRHPAALHRRRPARALGLLDQPGLHLRRRGRSSPPSAAKRARIPQEAIIGISYAVASAASILAMSKATSESEHLKDMLVGNILAVSWAEVLQDGRALRGGGRSSTTSSASKFLAISMDHARGARPPGLNVRLWDFLFYASFGFVVTSSVAIAGVLLVFCYLIVPSVAAMLYSEHIGRRLAIGWTMGTVVSALGIYLSVKLDLPTGATMVCTFGLVLILMAVVRPLVRAARGAQGADPAAVARRAPRHLVRDGQGRGEAGRVDADQVDQPGQAARGLLGDHEVADALPGPCSLGRMPAMSGSRSSSCDARAPAAARRSRRRRACSRPPR